MALKTKKENSSSRDHCDDLVLCDDLDSMHLKKKNLAKSIMKKQNLMFLIFLVQ